MSDFWPHQFTKNGRPHQIGENEFGQATMATPMICVHCHKEFVQGLDSRPPDPCPARNTQREEKRIHA